MMGKSFLCFVVAMAVVANAFMPSKLHQRRTFSVQMNAKESNIDVANWGRALAILSLTAGLYSSPAFAAETVAAPSTSVLKSVLNDYKEKSTIDPAASIAPVVATPVAKKVSPPVVKKVTPPPPAAAVKKVETPPPAPTPPAPIVYKIKPDVELLKKLEAAKKGGLSGSKQVVKEEVKPVVSAPVVFKAAPVVAKAAPVVVKAVEKATPAPVQKPKLPPAVATPVTVKAIVKQPVVKTPSIPEERAVVEAYNKKAGTKSKIDQLAVNVKVSKVNLLQSRSDMKKSESKIEAFEKKLSRGDLDKDLRKSLAQDKKEEEKVFNQARKVLTTSEDQIEKDTTEIGNLEKQLKADDKVIDAKKTQLKKREEEIIKEEKIASDKKLKAIADAKAVVQAKNVKAAEAVVAKAQSDLMASIDAKKQSQVQVAASKDLVKAEKEALKKASENVKVIMKALEKGKAQEDAEGKKIVDLASKVVTAELAENKAGDVIKSMEALVNEAKAQLALTIKNGK